MLRLNHVFHLREAFRIMFSGEESEGAQGEVSQFGALCTSLSATIGTGNIVGVATAIGAGGPGALLAPVVGRVSKDYFGRHAKRMD